MLYEYCLVEVIEDYCFCVVFTIPGLIINVDLIMKEAHGSAIIQCEDWEYFD